MDKYDVLGDYGIVRLRDDWAERGQYEDMSKLKESVLPEITNILMIGATGDSLSDGIDVLSIYDREYVQSSLSSISSRNVKISAEFNVSLMNIAKDIDQDFLNQNDYPEADLIICCNILNPDNDDLKHAVKMVSMFNPTGSATLNSQFHDDKSKWHDSALKCNASYIITYGETGLEVGTSFFEGDDFKIIVPDENRSDGLLVRRGLSI